jgi:hypothetical protein
MTKTIGGKAKRLKRQARLDRQRTPCRKMGRQAVELEGRFMLLEAFYERIYAGDSPEQARDWVRANKL